MPIAVQREHGEEAEGGAEGHGGGGDEEQDAAWRAAAHGEGIVTDGAASQSGALPNWLLLGTGSQNGARARLRGCGVCPSTSLTSTLLPSTSLRTGGTGRTEPQVGGRVFCGNCGLCGFFVRLFGLKNPAENIFSRKNRENRRNLRRGRAEWCMGYAGVIGWQAPSRWRVGRRKKKPARPCPSGRQAGSKGEMGVVSGGRGQCAGRLRGHAMSTASEPCGKKGLRQVPG